jgi:hypothetical protein
MHREAGMKRLAATMLLIATCLLLHGILSLAQDTAPAPVQETATAAPAQDPGLDQGLIYPYLPSDNPTWNPAVLPPPAGDYTIFYSPPEKLDALFDAMMDAIPYASFDDYVAKNPDATYMEFISSVNPKPGLPALKALQSRFGDMPEYWQMMYAFGEGDRRERSVYLSKAYHLFLYDPATVYFYARFAMMPGGDTSGKYKEDDITAYRMKRDAATMLARAAELDGRNSFYWYEAANTISQCGGVEETLAYIRSGNECAVSEVVEPFPFSYIARHHDELSTQYPDKYLLLQPLEFSERLSSLIGYKNMLKNVTTGVSLSGELGWLTDAHRMACRFATQRYSPFMIVLMGGVFDGILSKSAIDLGYAPETPEEVKGFALFENKRGEISGLCKAASFTGQNEVEERLGLTGMNLSSMKPADPRFKEYVQCEWQNDSDFVRVMMPHIQKQYERLIAFDFANPSAYNGLPLPMQAVQKEPEETSK